MTHEKRARLEDAGWTFGDYGDFLGFTDAERAAVERQIADIKALQALGVPDPERAVLNRTDGPTPHEFTLILGDVEITDAFENAVLAAGCDDATLTRRSGVTQLAFTREARSLGEAVLSAVADIRRAGVEVVGVECQSG